MSYDDNSLALLRLINHASEIDMSIHMAIVESDNEKVDVLSTQYEEVVRAILSFASTTLAELKIKCEFGQRLLLRNNNDEDILREVFAKLLYDIENLDNT